MSRNEIDTIVFDLGNTLIRFDHNIAVKKLVGRFKIDPKAVYELFFDSDLTRTFEKGLVSPKEFHDRVSRRLGIKLAYREFEPIWNDIFWEDEGSSALARRLKKTHRLILLSNVNESHFKHIRKKFDIIKIFDELILSFKLGVMKPDRRIYDEVIRLAGGDKKTIVYIDDREDLIKEARLLGIDSIRYEGSAKLVEELKKRKVL